MKMWLKIGLLSLLALNVTEVALRLYAQGKVDELVKIPLVYRPDSLLGYRYVPGSDFRLGKDTVHINRYGYIGPEPARRKDRFRLAIVGDSHVSGPLHRKEYRSYCAALQREFDREGYRVEVLNCGVDGANRSLELLRSVEGDVMALEPDLVLLEYGLPLSSDRMTRECYGGYVLCYERDSLRARDGLRERVDRMNRVRPALEPLLHTYIFLCLARKYRHKWPESEVSRTYIRLLEKGSLYVPGKVCSLSMEESAARVDSVRRRLARRGTAFFLLNSRNRPDARDTARIYGLPLVSPAPGLEKTDYYNVDNHLNGTGCEKLARALFRILTAGGLVPRPGEENG